MLHLRGISAVSTTHLPFHYSCFVGTTHARRWLDRPTPWLMFMLVKADSGRTFDGRLALGGAHLDLPLRCRHLELHIRGMPNQCTSRGPPWTSGWLVFALWCLPPPTICCAAIVPIVQLAPFETKNGRICTRVLASTLGPNYCKISLEKHSFCIIFHVPLPWIALDTLVTMDNDEGDYLQGISMLPAPFNACLHHQHARRSW